MFIRTFLIFHELISSKENFTFVYQENDLLKDK